MTDIDSKAEMEAQRGASLMLGLARTCYGASEERENEHNFKFETIGVVTIVTWMDDDGNAKEDVAYAFETRRHYVKTGILQDTLAAHLTVRKDDATD